MLATMAKTAVLMLIATAIHAQPPTIAVTDLLAQGVEPSEAMVISDQLRNELVRKGKIKLIERSQMETILKEQGFQQSGCTADECAVEMGQLLGVQFMIVGTLGRAGSYTIISGRILDVQSGEIVSTETIRTKGGINSMVEKGVSELATNLLGSFFSAKPQTHPDRPSVAADSEQPESAAAQTTLAKKSKGKIVLWAGLGAVALGGGITVAALLATPDNTGESGSSTPEPNVRIPLP